ncbi:MAG TPA: Hsp20/alpha crystallin family protein [Casimicrobiaceae bacterium]|nr:Hsp20/alpha crystallin family protein [Casimicrobiaceae bacterium]
MSSRDPADWMWRQAIELFEQAERMHRQFFRLAATERTPPAWEPPVDVFEDQDDVVIVVALPGVPADRLEVTYEPGLLVVRAERPLPFSRTGRAVRQLEIPYGCFERRIPLAHVQLDTATRELVDGCLILRLRKA